MHTNMLKCMLTCMSAAHLCMAEGKGRLNNKSRPRKVLQRCLVYPRITIQSMLKKDQMAKASAVDCTVLHFSRTHACSLVGTLREHAAAPLGRGIIYPFQA